MALEFTDSNFEELVLDSDKLAVVDFWAVWCGPCRMVGPIIEQLHDEYKDVVVGKVDVDNNPGISQRYGIRNIPTVLFIKDGVVVDKQVGAAPKGTYAGKIDALLV
ncbi:MAG: thioredoxin [Chitinophagales bacterium]